MAFMERRRSEKTWQARERAARVASHEAIDILSKHSRGERLPEQGIILALAKSLESYGRYGFASQLRKIARPMPVRAVPSTR